MPVLRHAYFGRPTFMPMKAHLHAKFTEGLWNAAADELWPGGHSLRLTTQSGRHGGCVCRLRDPHRERACGECDGGGEQGDGATHSLQPLQIWVANASHARPFWTGGGVT